MDAFHRVPQIVREFVSLPLLASPDQGDHDPLNLQFLLWNQIGIARIFRAQIRFAPLDNESFKRHPAIDQRSDNIAGARLHPVLDDRNVSVDDIFSQHRIAMHFQAKSPGAGLDSQSLDINEHTAFFVLGSVLGQAGWDRTVDGYRHDLRATLAGYSGAHDLKRASAARQIFQSPFSLQRLHVCQGSIGAAEAEMRGNFTQGWGKPCGILLVPDEVQNLLLSIGEFLHNGNSDL
jgi:hypothetical protein